MGSKKCRLCLCAVNNLAGVSASIEDDSFYSIIKTVFRFPVPKLHAFGSENYALSALVCFQCATSVRNFYYFSLHVESNQKKPQRECEAKQKPQSINSGRNDWTLGELIQHFRTETESDAATSGENCMDTLSSTTEVESTASDNNRIILKQEELIISESDCEGFDDLEDEIHSDLQQNRGDNHESTDLRLCTAKTHRNAVEIHTNDSQHTITTGLTRRESFKFSLIKTKEELTVFDAKLLDRAYFQKVLDWLTDNVIAKDCNNRMLEAQDLIFHKEFLVKCSWTGLGKHSMKIEFKSFINVLRLFKEIGSTRFHSLSDRELAIYFMNKLKHAKERLHAKGIVKSSCRKRRSKTPLSW
ncbi:uncharacterized protein LOC131262127 [Anopheles coustani]|uniref:uncharacterized protein LOC131262127 n=1 Tax=Anopheles coustani TaxID=139045 RepID=UPI00265B44B3|nr:uncharacterized protein LOC131262127 [Anopheles coustani]